MEEIQVTEDILASETSYVRASAGKRFLNYLIDVLLFYVIIVGVSALFYIFNPSALEETASQTSAIYSLWDRLISLIFYALYMGLVEALFKGKSLGKLITGTRAVNLDGSRISVGTAFARGFCRAVPFCAFSAFGNPSDPWQDRWTNTMVIDEKQTIHG